jgi:uncharacterized small protein (DUF1192 family)
LSYYRASAALQTPARIVDRRTAMDLDELEPRNRPAAPKPLDGFSIGELRDYIARLEAEIVRARTAIAKKEGHRTGADALFKL